MTLADDDSIEESFVYYEKEDDLTEALLKRAKVLLESMHHDDVGAVGDSRNDIRADDLAGQAGRSNLSHVSSSRQTRQDKTNLFC